ncbi:MAG: hypothetical protein AMXMBFR33_41260 [Candidatus Xenobia bacterium]
MTPPPGSDGPGGGRGDSTASIAFLRWLWQPGEVRELRTLGDCPPCTGYFDGPEGLLAAALAAGRNPAVRGVYLSLNPVLPELMGRAANRLRQASRGESTKDHEIVRRRVLLLDVDPVRPAGINASHAEHKAAHDLAAVIREDLAAAGWSEPAVVDTGNGAALWYPVDLPAEDDGLLHRCLQALAARYDTDTARVDVAVANASRIARLPGTANRKGDHLPDRPQRPCRALEVPT